MFSLFSVYFFLVVHFTNKEGTRTMKLRSIVLLGAFLAGGQAMWAEEAVTAENVIQGLPEGTKEVVAEKKQTIVRNYLVQFDGVSQRTHVITADLAEICGMELKKAYGELFGRELLSATGSRHEPTIGVDVGLFRRGGSFNGAPVGFLMINSKIFTDAGVKGAAFRFDEKTRKASIIDINPEWGVLLGTLAVPIDRINQPMMSDKEIVYYDPMFGKTTRTGSHAVEIRVVEGKFTQITHGWGNGEIPLKGYVLAVGKNHPLASINWEEYLTQPCSESIVSPSMRPEGEHDNIIQGLMLLVRNGAIVDSSGDYFVGNEVSTRLPDEDPEAALNAARWADITQNRHPRGALGLDTNGNLYVVVVECDDAEAQGMTIPELSLLMQELGCVDAILVSSGKSVGLWAEGQYVPGDATAGPEQKKEEIPVGAALLLYE